MPLSQHPSSAFALSTSARVDSEALNHATATARPILVVDDHPEACREWASRLRKMGHAVEECGGAAEALVHLHEKAFAALLSDVQMERRDDGLLLARVVKSRWRLPVVLYTAFGNPDDHALAAELGVDEYCASSEPGNVIDALRRAIRKQHSEPASGDPVIPVSARVRWERPIALSWSMQQVLQQVAHVAPEELPILITGETGVGKDVVAREIHRRSHRGKQPFVALNCGAITEHLMESELFGHCRGAFTGAEANKPGLVEAADGGTLFLDEVTELSLKIQVAMLRFLDGGEFRRVGETAVRRVNVRILAATNRSVKDAVASGRFRQDLHYRIRAVNLHVPPIRERREDIGDFANVWRLLRAGVTGLPAVVTPDAISRLEKHAWRGNFRELEHALDWAALEAPSGIIHEREIAIALKDSANDLNSESSGSIRLPEDKRAERRNEAQRALERSGGNRREAAKLLKKTRWTLWRRLKE